jgi:hypothetical protein
MEGDIDGGCEGRVGNDRRIMQVPEMEVEGDA